jgi:hypothetical protein
MTPAMLSSDPPPLTQVRVHVPSRAPLRIHLPSVNVGLQKTKSHDKFRRRSAPVRDEREELRLAQQRREIAQRRLSMYHFDSRGHVMLKAVAELQLKAEAELKSRSQP